MSLFNQKKVLHSEIEARKNFKYELDGVSFSVSLRTDIKREMVAMREILQKADEDFKKELSILDNKKQ